MQASLRPSCFASAPGHTKYTCKPAPARFAPSHVSAFRGSFCAELRATQVDVSSTTAEGSNSRRQESRFLGAPLVSLKRDPTASIKPSISSALGKLVRENKFSLRLQGDVDAQKAVRLLGALANILEEGIRPRNDIEEQQAAAAPAPAAAGDEEIRIVFMKPKEEEQAFPMIMAVSKVRGPSNPRLVPRTLKASSNTDPAKLAGAMIVDLAKPKGVAQVKAAGNAAGSVALQAMALATNRLRARRPDVTYFATIRQEPVEPVEEGAEGPRSVYVFSVFAKQGMRSSDSPSTPPEAETAAAEAEAAQQ